MSSETNDPLLDGFAILERLSIEEIDSRVAWLEEALATYKTLAIVKRLAEKKPLGVVPPWESVVPTAEPGEDEERLAYGEGKRRIQTALERHPNGLTLDELVKLTDLPRKRIYTCLRDNRGRYQKFGTLYRLRDTTAAAEILPLETA